MEVIVNCHSVQLRLVMLQPSQTWQNSTFSLPKPSLINTGLVQNVSLFWWVPVCAHAFVQVWKWEPLPDVGRVPSADPGAGGGDGLPGGVCQPVWGHHPWVQTAPTMQVKPGAGRRKYHKPVPNSRLMSHYSRDALLHSQSVSELWAFLCWLNLLCLLSFIPKAWGGPAEGAMGHDRHGGIQHGRLEDNSMERDPCGGHGTRVQMLF